MQRLGSFASDVAGTAVTATGGTKSRALTARAGDVLSVWDFGVVGDGMTDDSVAVAAACTALRGTGKVLYVPGNCRLRMGGAAQPWLSGMSIKADGARETGTPGPGIYGQRGGTFLLTDTAAPPFVVSDDWALDGLIFNWPNQTEAAAVSTGRTQTAAQIAASSGYPVVPSGYPPIPPEVVAVGSTTIVNYLPAVYPPLIVPHKTGSNYDQVRNWRVSRCQIQNAFDVVDLVMAPGVGAFWWEDNQSFALRWHFRLNSVGDEHFIRDSHFTPGAYTYGILGTSTTNLRDYAALNATVMRIEGNGNASVNQGGSSPPVIASTAVEGTRMSGCYAFLMRYGIRVVGGSLNLATLVGNGFDQVPTPIQVEAGGLIEATVTGGNWLATCLSSALLAPPALSVTGGPATAGSGSTLLLTNVDMAETAGGGILWSDPGVHSTLSVSGGRIAYVGQNSTGYASTGVDFTAANGILTIAGVPITTLQPGGIQPTGVLVRAALASIITGATASGWYSPFGYLVASGQHVLSGSSTANTTGAGGAVVGAGASLVAQAGNSWDLGNNWNVVTVPAGSEGGIKMVGPDASLTVVAASKGGGGFLAQNDLGVLLDAQPYTTALQVNYLLVQSAPAGLGPQIQPAGSDTNISLAINPKGTGQVDIGNAFLTGIPVASTAAAGTSTTQLATTAFATTAAANAAAGTGVTLSGGTVLATPATGLGLLIQGPQGPLLDVLPYTGAAQANYLVLQGAPTGYGPQITPQGSDTDISIAINPKGAGQIDIGSANLTGVPIAPTASAGTSTTQLATTAFVAGAINSYSASASVPPSPATANPLADGAVAVGTSALYARQDHVHPTDATRQSAAQVSAAIAAASPTRTVSATTDTPTTADNNGLVIYTSNSAVTVTATDLAGYRSYSIIQAGAGQITVAAGSGVTLVSDKATASFKSARQWATLTILCTGTGAVAVIGNTA